MADSPKLSEQTDIASDIGCDIVMGMPRTRMHQTTIRFEPYLWEQLEREAAEQGISVAQFVRSAALTILAYTSGFQDGSDASKDQFGRADVLREIVKETYQESRAVQAQSSHAHSRAQSARKDARAMRESGRARRVS